MAKIKRVFVVEGIDDGKTVGTELIKLANRLVEEEGLDISSTAREKIIGDLLSPGKFARVVAYMSHGDIANLYSQPGGVKKFLAEALADQADVTAALAMVNGGLANSDGWLQQPALKSGRMTFGSLNGPEDRAVILNVPKSAMNHGKPVSGKDGVQAVLEKILSHNNFIAHLDYKRAKTGIDPEAKSTEELVNHFDFSAITGYKSKEDRANAMREFEEAKKRKAETGQQEKTVKSAVSSNAHKFRKWIEEYRLEHRLPKTETAAHQFYFKAVEKLEQLAPDDEELQHKVREAGVAMIKPDTNLWRYLVEGNIEHYMKVIQSRADAAGETLPKDDKPKVKPEEKKEEPKADETPAEKPAEPAPAGGGDLPKALQTTADKIADNIKGLPAWDPKHRGSLLAAIEKALSGQ